MHGLVMMLSMILSGHLSNIDEMLHKVYDTRLCYIIQLKKFRQTTTTTSGDHFNQGNRTQV